MSRPTATVGASSANRSSSCAARISVPRRAGMETCLLSSPLPKREATERGGCWARRNRCLGDGASSPSPTSGDGNGGAAKEEGPKPLRRRSSTPRRRCREGACRVSACEMRERDNEKSSSSPISSRRSGERERERNGERRKVNFLSELPAACFHGIASKASRVAPFRCDCID